MIRFTARRAVDTGRAAPPLSAAAIEEARSLMPGADPYALEADWRAFWAQSGRPRLRSVDGAFLGFVRGRAARLD